MKGAERAANAAAPRFTEKLTASALINAARARRELSQSEADILWNENLNLEQCALALARVKQGTPLARALRQS